ncbi:acyl carrier protein [Eubacterium ventriosum]|jgi:acyl carrier protein|uniref:Acyl carrier protein n=1 Tax=Eubacterium ventriosum TaxID=39496 RepID=A0A415LH77_9FIRM|nr:acyl carrier protein [Eubacterium ventriosum]RHL47896.1 acyl carrier protein [Eubacterium ventriosum]
MENVSKEQVRDFLSKITGEEDKTDSDVLGFDSFETMKMIVELEDRFDIEFEDDDIMELKKETKVDVLVDKVANMINGEKND